ncbi:AEX-3 domain-containing protein [Lipomyces orientalis]|uniref:AEX-3 domain-containing protein n=1 Tax=Lipomyces orientalis TaxID=1233043 RepID=A0ACC3TRA9_9ASCO
MLGRTTQIPNATSPTGNTRVSSRAYAAVKSRTLPLPVADFFFIVGVDQTVLNVFIDQAHPRGSPIEDNPKVDEKTFKRLDNGLGHSMLQSVIIEEHGNEKSGNIVITETRQERERSNDNETVTFEVSPTVDNNVLITSEQNHIANQEPIIIEETSKDLNTLAAVTGSPSSNNPVPEIDAKEQGSTLSPDATGIVGFISEPENAMKVKPSPNSNAEQHKASGLQHRPLLSTSSRSSPLQRSSTLRRVSASKLRQSPSLESKTFGHARRISDYDSVIPDPEPITWSPTMHPLDRKIDPALLDIYPRDETQRNARGGLPEYVPMFAFPDDIQIQLSDERPRSTWHQFVLTNQDGKKRYGTCLTVWIELPKAVAEAIEKLSEQWRLNNISELDREFASSLSSRLVNERTKLLQLMTALSLIGDAGHADERREINDEIAMTQERIKILVDLLRPIKSGARVDSKSYKSTMWIPRVYGLISRDMYSGSFRLEWLKAVLHGEIVAGRTDSGWLGQRVPMEYAVSQLLAEPVTLADGFQVRVDIGDIQLFARHHAVSELPGSRDTDLYPLFRCLSIKSIIELFEAVLSEARIILVSSDLAMLTNAAAAVTSLMFPLKWQSVYIPVLPGRLVSCLEMPVPYIIGIHRTGSELLLPEDDYVLCDLDADAIVSTATPPFLPTAVRNKLQSLLSLSAPLHSLPFNVDHGTPRYVSEAFPDDVHVLIDADLMRQIPAPHRLNKFVAESSTAYHSADADSVQHPPVVNVRESGTIPEESRDHQQTASEFQGSELFAAHPPRSRRSSTGYVLKVGKTGIQSLTSSLRTRRKSTVFPGESISGGGSTDRDRATSLAGHNLSSRLRPMSTAAMHGISPSSIYSEDPTISSPQSSEFRTVEGHVLRLVISENLRCSVCLDGPLTKPKVLVCESCHLQVHTTCLSTVVLPCTQSSFHVSRVRAAFIRSMATLLYSYRQFLDSLHDNTSMVPKLYRFRQQEFLTSLPKEQMPYTRFLLSTQAGTEFIHDIESYDEEDSEVMLFDAIIGARRKRGLRGKIRPGPGSRGGSDDAHADLLSARAAWRTADIPMCGNTEGYLAAVSGLVRTSPRGRWPARLDCDVLRTCTVSSSADNKSPYSTGYMNH